MSDCNGKCPLCRGQLILSDGILTCAEKPHYSIAQVKFEHHWLMYDYGAIDAEALLRALRTDNLARTGKAK